MCVLVFLSAFFFPLPFDTCESIFASVHLHETTTAQSISTGNHNEIRYFVNGLIIVQNSSATGMILRRRRRKKKKTRVKCLNTVVKMHTTGWYCTPAYRCNQLIYSLNVAKTKTLPFGWTANQTCKIDCICKNKYWIGLCDRIESNFSLTFDLFNSRAVYLWASIVFPSKLPVMIVSANAHNLKTIRSNFNYFVAVITRFCCWQKTSNAVIITRLNSENNQCKQINWIDRVGIETHL